MKSYFAFNILLKKFPHYFIHRKPTTDESGTAAVPKYSEDRKPYLKLTHNGTDPVVVKDYQLRASNMAFWNILIPSLKSIPPVENSDAYGPLTWGFIALSVILLVLVILLVVFIILLKRSSVLRRIN